MVALARYVTHPQVEIEPDVPVAQWRLSRVGLARAEALAKRPWLQATRRVVTSGETKALETGAIVAKALGLVAEWRDAMHENDRASTGYLPADEFESVMDRFFDCPDSSARGWERAVDAQTRIVAEVDEVLQEHESGDVLFVGHGAVGTLLLCHVAGIPIDRAHDQPRGGGNCFAFTIDGRRLVHGWRAIEDDM